MLRIILKKSRETSVYRRHPWIFSGGIHQVEGKAQNGALAAVYSHDGKVLGTGFYQNSSISVRLLVFGSAGLPNGFWQDRIGKAWTFRKSLGLPGKNTNMFRLIHGEGDELPGLIVDVYGGTAVVQFHDSGMYGHREDIAAALMGLEDAPVKAVYNKSSDTLHAPEISVVDGYLAGEALNESSFTENGLSFHVNWEQGQKTGFFLDQRDNRELIGRYAKDKKVLNAFSYTGGFSIYALASGARDVVSMDISQPALDMAETNGRLLGPTKAKRHRVIRADVVKHLKQDEEQYDLIVLDPPAFAKRMSARHNAIQAYKRLNATALRKLPDGGMLFTFSCSQVVTRAIFEDTILAAALEVGRPVRILHRMAQGPDHPVNIFHPESEYLKGLVLQVG